MTDPVIWAIQERHGDEWIIVDVGYTRDEARTVQRRFYGGATTRIVKYVPAKSEK
jgi:hypothetical protein